MYTKYVLDHTTLVMFTIWYRVLNGNVKEMSINGEGGRRIMERPYVTV